MAQSVSEGNSILLLHSLASAAECTELLAEVMDVAQRELDERAELAEFGLLDDVLADDAGRVRLRVAERLGDGAQALCNRFLCRALGRLSSLPNSAAFFGSCLAECGAGRLEDMLHSEVTPAACPVNWAERACPVNWEPPAVS